ncbi:MAG: DUF2817 domain-containing protein [Flavobacterium sp.]|nr:MAG: DUF2817 domain-containing protein [Flavobacterium sp.]
MDFQQLFQHYKEPKLFGRYITLEKILPLIDKLKSVFEVTDIGRSISGENLYLCKVGTGKTKMLLWSQMHGNEGTTTKALFDLFNLLSDESDLSKKLLGHFTFYAVPMLNPDGAKRYTRENANGVDLNRDFFNLSQPESQSLFKLFTEIKPDYCFNLHDQRTIYGVGYSGRPATVSFLAPSYNEACEINQSRAKAIDVIAEINKSLQQLIPGQVGRFDDSFNINCAGDTFQLGGTPTILFEAGHFPGDYEREVTRKYIFTALLSSLIYISENDIVGNRIEEYLNIPQNSVSFHDIVYKNVKINYDGIEKITNFAAQYQEVLNGGEIDFEAVIADVGLNKVFGHLEVDAQQQLYRDGKRNIPELEQKADFYIGSTKFVNGLKV